MSHSYVEGRFWGLKKAHFSCVFVSYGLIFKDLQHDDILVKINDSLFLSLSLPLFLSFFFNRYKV